MNLNVHLYVYAWVFAKTLLLYLHLLAFHPYSHLKGLMSSATPWFSSQFLRFQPKASIQCLVDFLSSTPSFMYLDSYWSLSNDVVSIFSLILIEFPSQKPIELKLRWPLLGSLFMLVLGTIYSSELSQYPYLFMQLTPDVSSWALNFSLILRSLRFHFLGWEFPNLA